MGIDNDFAEGTLYGDPLDVFGYRAAQGIKDAAARAAEAERGAISEYGRQFDITQEQYEPYRQAGIYGLQNYERMLGQRPDIQYNVPEPFQFGQEEYEQYRDPGYEFRAEEGLRAADRRLAARGKRRSGQRSRTLMELGQEMESEEFGAARGRAYQDYGTRVAREAGQYGRDVDEYGRLYVDPLSRYGQLAGRGQATTTGLGGLRSSYASAVNQAYGNIGGLQGAGQLGQAQVYGGTLQNIGNVAGQFWGNRQSGGYSGDYFNTNVNTPYGQYAQGDAYLPGGLR